MGHTVIWTGSQMIVWGGYSGGIGYNDGGLYDPIHDTWAVNGTSLTNAPTARYLHTAVWTGSQMIVWGGSDTGGGDTNTGGRYTPANDQWNVNRTNLTNAPSAREGHAAIWTGSEMIVWGGNGARTGARYSPTSDSWTTMSVVDAPSSAPSGLAAVWTDSEMLVFGAPELGRYIP